MTSPTQRVRRHRPLAMGASAMVSSAHSMASMIGIDVLRSGGNAIDAAIAVNAALNVTQSGQCGIGGDLFALVYIKREGRVRFLNASGRSPASADPEQLVNEGAKHLPQRGIRSVTVPGCVDGWCTLNEAYGTAPLDELLRPAVRLAREGYPISHYMVEAIESTLSLAPHQSWVDVFAPNGHAPKPGDIFRQPELATTLERIGNEGRSGFYDGPFVDAVLELSDELGGWFTREDFHGHTSDWGEPISSEYKEYTVYETPPNTQGFAALMGLNVLAGWNEKAWEWSDPDRVHHMVEAKKRIYVERDAHVADPAFYRAPLERLLSPQMAAEIRAGIDPGRAHGIHDTPLRLNGTTYFAIADPWGNLVSCVQSLYKGYGSLLVPAGTGVALHNRGGHFSLRPEHPNYLQPRKRPFHTLIASMAFKGDDPTLVFGTMGGCGQPQTHLQVFSNLFDYGMDMQEAIEAPRWAHDTADPVAPQNELLLEGRFDSRVFDALSQKGHTVRRIDHFDKRVGNAQGIRIERGVYFGGADPRGDGVAIGW